MKSPKYFLPMVGFCLSLWIVLFVCRILFAEDPTFIIHLVAKLVYLPHLFIILATFKIYKNSGQNDQKILLWLIITNIGLCLNDASWYFVSYFHFNLIHISSVPFLLNLIPFFLWVVAIIVFSVKILNNYVLHIKHNLRIFSAVIIINFVIILLFLSAINYTSEIFSLLTVSQISTFIAQIIVFDFVVLCLIYTESKGLLIFLSGIIILISGDFLIIYSIISQTAILYSYGELLWFLGLLFNLFGILMLQYKANYSIRDWIRKDNTIKSKLILSYFGMAIVGFLLFFIVAYAFSVISRSDFLGLPMCIMIYSIIVIILFSYVGEYFETPFKQIANNIKILMQEEKKLKVNINFPIEEFMFLQQFITNAFIYKEEKEQEHLKLEREYIKNDMLKLENQQLEFKHENQKIKLQLEEQTKFRTVADQMAHDLGSPLMALDVLQNQCAELPENKRYMLRESIKNIREIANSLLSQYKPKEDINDIPDEMLVYAVIEQVIMDKRNEYHNLSVVFNFEVTNNDVFSFIKINTIAFKRMLSNLINNAVEALDRGKPGIISISLSELNNQIAVAITDNGKGMPQTIIDKIINKDQVTSGKEKGKGIGFSQIHETLELSGANINITSQLDIGTTITLSFPPAALPEWIATQIEVQPTDIIVILDDDNAIHGAWDLRFSPLLKTYPNLQIRHFTLASEAIKFINELFKAESNNLFLLTDYELLKQNLTGLDVINFTKAKRAILVTSHYNSIDVRRSSYKANVKILPKMLASLVNIEKIIV